MRRTSALLVAMAIASVIGGGVALAAEITGTNAGETRNGTTGNDTIDGGSGRDTLGDLINGGFGSDTCFFDPGNTVISC